MERHALELPSADEWSAVFLKLDGLSGGFQDIPRLAFISIDMDEYGERVGKVLLRVLRRWTVRAMLLGLAGWAAGVGIHVLQQKSGGSVSAMPTGVFTSSSTGDGTSKSTGNGTLSQGGSPSATDEASLQAILGGIPGLQEVALSGTATNETVIATIEVPYGTDPTLASSTLSSLTQAYLADAFAGDPHVRTAQLYFVQDGELVAGGALTRQGYQTWTVDASSQSSHSGLLQWMAGLRSSGTTKGVGWFQLASPPPEEGVQ